MCQEKGKLAVMSGYSNTTTRGNHGLYFTLGNIRRSLKNTMIERVHTLNSGKAFIYGVIHYLTLQKLKYHYNDIDWIQSKLFWTTWRKILDVKQIDNFQDT